MRRNYTRNPLLFDHLPPHDKDTERAVLSVIFTVGSIPTSAQVLTKEEFYIPLHAGIWGAMGLLTERGIGIDPISVRDVMIESMGEDCPKNLPGLLASLLEPLGIRENVAFYVDVLKRNSLLRDAIRTSAEIATLSISPHPDLQELLRITERQADLLRERSAGLDSWGFPFRTWDLSTNGMAEAQKVVWTIEPIMAAPDVVSLVGDGGVGKSKVAAAVSLAVGFGKPVLGRFAVPRTGRVVYLNEERPDLTVRHLHTLARSLEVSPGEIAARIILLGRGTRPWRVTDSLAQRALIRRLMQLGDVALIVFDSLHVLHDAEENDNAEMTKVIEAFRRICLEVGCCGLIIHHTGKGIGGEAAASARGASAIKDSVDSQLIVRRSKSDDPAELRIHQDKTRRALVPAFLVHMEHDSSGDVLAIRFAGTPPTKAETVLEEVIAVILAADAPLKSGEVLLKLAGRYRKDDVYSALARIREQNLVPWSSGPRGSFVYGGEADGPDR